MVNIVILNVGANTQDPGFRGPIFEDGSFKFIPITENPDYPGPTYRELGLEEHVPEDCLDKKTHPDPDFTSHTYGHVERGFGDLAKIRQLQPGDYLFFLATLDYHGTQSKRQKWINPDWGAYLIGYFRIQQILDGASFSNQPKKLQQLFEDNTHYEDGEFLGDLAIKGDEHSALLSKAIPLSHTSISHQPNEFTQTTLLADWISQNPNKEPSGWYRWVHIISDEQTIIRLWEEINAFNPNQSKKASYE